MSIILALMATGFVLLLPGRALQFRRDRPDRAPPGCRRWLARLRELGRLELRRGSSLDGYLPGGSSLDGPRRSGRRVDQGRELGTFVDALVTCVEAGLPLGVALEVVLESRPRTSSGLVWDRLAERVHHAAMVGLEAQAARPAPARRARLVDKAGAARAVAPARVPGLRLLEGAVRLSARTGAPLGPALRSVGTVVREAAAGSSRAQVLAAGPTATMGLLTALPLLGPLAIWILGWPPSQVYTGGAVPLAVLGLGLTALGWAWSRRLLRRAARATRLPVIAGRADGSAPITDVTEAMVLLALALRTGTGVTECIEQVAEVTTGRVAADLRVAAAARRWGCEPGTEWVLAGPAWQELALAWAAADRAGAAPAGLVVAAATRLRDAEQRALEERIQRAAVLLVLPLGACFLPGFLLTTVVPPVLALAGRLL